MELIIIALIAVEVVVVSHTLVEMPRDLTGFVYLGTHTRWSGTLGDGLWSQESRGIDEDQ